MVVFDELPGPRADGRQAAGSTRSAFRTSPRSAEDATWYPNATTSRSDTELAVPTLATGINAPLDSLGTDRRPSPLALHAARLEPRDARLGAVDEPLPGRALRRARRRAPTKAASARSSRRSRRSSATSRCPTRSGSGSRARARAAPSAGRARSRPSPRRSSRPTGPSSISSTSSSRTRRGGTCRRASGTPTRSEPTPSSAGSRSGTTTSGRCSRHEQRFLLQLQYTDKLLGGLLDKLRAEGLYDDSLIVVAADHGVSFRAGDQRRDATETNAADILSVPLFVKLPGQREGEVDEAAARTVDVVPTIADAIGAEIPWEVDGESLLGEPTSRPADRDREPGRRRGRADPGRVHRAPSTTRSRGESTRSATARTACTRSGRAPSSTASRSSRCAARRREAEATIVDGSRGAQLRPGFADHAGADRG